MSEPTPAPAPGEMRLFDAVEVPLTPGMYRLVAEQTVTFDGETEVLPVERRIVVEGPRFSLPPDEVAAVVPPRNGAGDANAVPQVVLHRRTLPWEHPLGTGPGVALLVLEEGEYSLLDQVPLEHVVPADARARMGNPGGVVCDAVELDATLLAQVIPSRDELALLCHVRRVNVADSALAGADDDGWFAVVLANRLPTAGRRHRAFLVSVEERTDVVPVDPPAVADPAVLVHEVLALDRVLAPRSAVVDRMTGFEVAPVIPPGKRRLVVLHHWGFDATSGATFRDRMQALSVGAIGDGAVTDTGHVALDLQDRAGDVERVWYRGPLVPFELTRDENGPYHSADQCRRVSPETGLEDVTYAAAFEVGRLLAASDGRLAQELSRWRRTAYGATGRRATLAEVGDVLALSDPMRADLAVAAGPTVGVGVLAAAERPVRADPGGLGPITKVPGLDPKRVGKIWNLDDAAAGAVLRGTDLVATIAKESR